VEEWRLTERFGAAYATYRQEVPMVLPWKGIHYQPGPWTLGRAWHHKGFRLLAQIPLTLLAIEAVEELRQGHFIFASLQRLVMR
jgi:hypothetical protein